MQIREEPLGYDWLFSLCMWHVGHNLAVAGALEYARRLGAVEVEFEQLPTIIRNRIVVIPGSEGCFPVR
jgi:hypothetical protein